MRSHVTNMFIRHMSTPCRVTRPNNFPLKEFEKKTTPNNVKSSYYYMYRALINYKNLKKVKNNLSN